MKSIAVIPARFKSSRFPGKPLAEIENRPLIYWVYQNVIKAKGFADILVATDDERIEQACRKYKMNVIMTSDSHPTGIDRMAEVAEKVEAELYVNIQGDEPLIRPETIELVFEPFFAGESNVSVVNFMTEIKRENEIASSTVPKVVVNSRSQAIFLSRCPVPFPKGETPRYFKQVCIYGITPEALSAFSRFERGPAERAEDIEILRFIENRIIVKMIEVEQDTVAVDTPADLELVKKIFREKGIR